MIFRPALLSVTLALASASGAGSAETPASESQTTDATDELARFRAVLARDDAASAATIAEALANQGEPAGMYALGVLMDIGAGLEIDPARASRWLRQAAERGHAGACRYLSWRCRSGFGAPGADPTEAARWIALAGSAEEASVLFPRWIERTEEGDVPNFRRAFLWMLDAAEAGRGFAQVNLARAYLGGNWTSPDNDQHLFWLRRAADNHHAASLEQLAFYHEHGVLVPPDASLALHYQQRAAEEGSVTAQFALGERYLTGRGVAPDGAQAAHWFRKAAEQEHVEAMLKLVFLMREGGAGQAPDFAEAMRFAERAASLGSVDGLTQVADLHNRGDGVPKDCAKSAEYYRQAAEKGGLRAMTMLGWIYLHGELGAPDYLEARRWFGQAAEGGDLRAMRELGVLYQKGLGGASDEAKAFEWFERAARAGEQFSQMRLSWMLDRGVGCEPDEEEVLVWFGLAAEQRDPQERYGGAAAAALAEAISTTPAGVLRHLLRGARAVAADWIPAQLVYVCDRVPPPDEAAARELLQACVVDPSLLSAEGCLPEAVLTVLERPGKLGDAAAATKLLARMVAGNRPQSQLILAEHAFVGRHTPFDLVLALRCARAAEDRKMTGAERVRAAIESVAAATEAERNGAKVTLRRLAESGDTEAARLLSRRFQGGIGEEYSPELARQFVQLSVRDPGILAEALKRFDETFADAPRPPGDAEIRARVEQALRSREKDAPPAVVYRHRPSYPMELRESGLEGRTVIQFVVDEEGVPRQVRATESTHPLFAAAGEGCIRLWRFAPGWKQGRAVATLMAQPLEFSLETESAGAKETEP